MKRPRAAAALLALLQLCPRPIAYAQCPSVPGGLERTVRQTLSHLDNALFFAKQDNMTMVKFYLDPVAQNARLISEASECYSSQAAAQVNACKDSINNTDRRIGDLFNQEQAIVSQLRDTEAKLANASEKKRLSEQSMADLRRSIDDARRNVDRTQQDLKDKWWLFIIPLGWIGYAVEAVEADKQLRRLEMTINDASRQLGDADQAHQNAAKLAAEFSRNREALQRSMSELRATRDQAQEALGRLTQSVVPLQQSSQFWSDASDIAKVGIGGRADELVKILSRLDSSDGMPPIDGKTLKLRDAMLQFAQKVDQNKALQAPEQCQVPATQGVAKEGSIVFSSESTGTNSGLFFVHRGQRHRIPDEETLRVVGGARPFINLSRAALEAIPLGDPMPSAPKRRLSHPPRPNPSPAQ
jgi:predicted  nucleic acid-binding Zn-ribbon protein